MALAAIALVSPLAPARADTDPMILPTPSLYGGMGLIDMRNARFMPDGYFSLSIAVKQPDDRIALSFQALPWLETTFRYSIDYALPPQGQRALYDRSFDVKIRLFEEGIYRPQVALGFQDIIGTGVYSGEYLVASKQWGPLDFTLGMGWGRLASRPAFENPLRLISGRFARRPGFTDESSGGTPLFTSFFRGPNVGLFGGIEYHTPIPKLTLKVEYSSDAYTRERDRQNVNYQPIPVNVGIYYRFWSNVDIGVALLGGKELAAQLNMAVDPTEPNFPTRVDEPPPFRSRTEDEVQAVNRATVIATGENSNAPWAVHFVDLTADRRPPDPAMEAATEQMQADLARRFRVTDSWVDGRTLVVQIAAKKDPMVKAFCDAYSAKAGPMPGVQEIALVGSDWNSLAFCSATARPIKVAATQIDEPPDAPSTYVDTSETGLAAMTAGIESQNISVEGIAADGDTLKVEIYNFHYLRDTEAVARTVRILSGLAPPQIKAFQVTTSANGMPLTTVTIPRTQIDALGQRMGTPAELWVSTLKSDADPGTDLPNSPSYPRFTWSVFPTYQDDLFDPDNPIFFGVGMAEHTELNLFPGFYLDDQATIDVYNNFDSIVRTSNSVLPHVRSDVSQYLKKGASGINNLTANYYLKLAPDLYSHFTAGYIETMFAGFGGEVLYRPFGRRWAIGADIYDVWQRDFDDLFGFRPYHTVTGHVTLYMELPWHDYVAKVSFGRYLARDYGGTLEIDRRFDSGIVIGAWATFTNVPFHTFGEGSFDKGIRIIIPTEWALPFGSQSKYELDLRPIQRDGGQMLDDATTLYDMTQTSSYGDMERQWADVFR